MEKTKVYIRERSWMARLAARKLGYSNVAMVWGRTIHLYGVSAETFLADRCWLRHELKHVAQYREKGLLGFLFKYIWETLRKGYYHNALEAEARQAEADETLIARFDITVSKKG